MRRSTLCLITPLLYSLAQAAFALDVKPVIQKLTQPWAVAELPSGSLLVTERRAYFYLISPSGEKRTIDGLPSIRAIGQGGLLDVEVARDFETSKEIFMSYVKPQGFGLREGLVLSKAVLDEKNARLTNIQELFELKKGTKRDIHFGGRIVEARDGTLYLTIGDRGEKQTAQDLSKENGSVVRVNRDGTIPKDNPFLKDAEAQDAIFSFGHRNPQGAALDLDGRLWITEHGAKGGDELNIIKKGVNYGWPVISYGRHYSGGKIGIGTAFEGMEQPQFYWDPSMAPSGLTFYNQRDKSGWYGHALAGGLKSKAIFRLDISGNRAKEIEKIDMSAWGRVRDLEMSQDGSILVVIAGHSYNSKEDGAILKIRP